MKLIYAHARSGSTQLLRHIEAAGLRGREEPFKPRKGRRAGFRIVAEPGDLGRYIAAIGASHLKHLWSDLPEPKNIELVANPAFDAILFLYRRNLADYALSMTTANLTKEWHGTESGPQGEMPLGDLRRFLRRIRREIPAHAGLLRDHAQGALTCVAYEDLYGMAGETAQRRAIVSSLGAMGMENGTAAVDAAIAGDFSPRGKYKGRDYYARIFSNYAEAEQIVTGAEHYFDDHPGEMPETIFAGSATATV